MSFYNNQLQTKQYNELTFQMKRLERLVLLTLNRFPGTGSVLDCKTVSSVSIRLKVHFGAI